MARKPHSTSLVLLLVCIFAFWWGISVLAQNSSNGNVEEVTDNSKQSASLGEKPSSPITVVESKNGDTYTYSGAITTASACDSVGSGIRYSSDQGGSVTVLLTTTPGQSDCAAAATPTQSFSVAINHPHGEPHFTGIMLNGNVVATTLVQN